MFKFKKANSVNKIIALAAIFITVVSSVYMYANKKTEVEVLSKFGSTGEEVRQIQEKLKRWGYYTRKCRWDIWLTNFVCS